MTDMEHSLLDRWPYDASFGSGVGCRKFAVGGFAALLRLTIKGQSCPPKSDEEDKFWKPCHIR